MTDRIKGIVVTFDKDIREDDAQKVIDAVAQLRGVCSVRSEVANPGDLMNRERIKHELTQKMWDILSPDKAG